MNAIVNYAHRGASGYCPENTMVAFKKGLELGATGIETDVQRTKDGKLVLIHDESVERTTGQQGQIKDLTYDEISRLDAGSWFGSEFAGETIPLLDELLEWAAPTELIINLELKNNAEEYTGMEQQVIDVIQQYGLSDRIIISSFNHYSLVTCKQLAPDIRTGILYGDKLYNPWAYAQSVGAEALHPYHLHLNEQIVREAAASGVISNPFTINEPEQMRELIEMGVAGIITDYPDRLAELLSSTVS